MLAQAKLSTAASNQVHCIHGMGYCLGDRGHSGMVPGNVFPQVMIACLLRTPCETMLPSALLTGSQNKLPGMCSVHQNKPIPTVQGSPCPVRSHCYPGVC